MSTNQVFNQLRQDLQNELTTTNQLLYFIATELRQIKEFTSPGRAFETNIKKNVTTMDTLGLFLPKGLDIENIPPVMRTDKAAENQANEDTNAMNTSNVDES
ncbi:hypothetical protein JYU34_001857 [Plutella xylostella]|uniref:Mediator of RNA polymerase II transcription subunit 8 n=1 Tax=Plutella xylostella TaxID=51655 RepID=A0ABQ7R4Z0_PLUXY|nr:hypothetical protein JYU34_001857 [Plutella xylostella]